MREESAKKLKIKFDSDFCFWWHHILVQLLARKWKYDGRTDQHWVESDESGEVWKLYLQQKDHIESKNAQNMRSFHKLEAGPDPFSVPGAPVEEGPVAKVKPEAEREKQDRLGWQTFVCCMVSP